MLRCHLIRRALVLSLSPVGAKVTFEIYHGPLNFCMRHVSSLHIR
jgi:hypothetical protein